MPPQKRKSISLKMPGPSFTITSKIAGKTTKRRITNKLHKHSHRQPGHDNQIDMMEDTHHGHTVTVQNEMIHTHNHQTITSTDANLATKSTRNDYDGLEGHVKQSLSDMKLKGGSIMINMIIYNNNYNGPTIITVWVTKIRQYFLFPLRKLRQP